MAGDFQFGDDGDEAVGSVFHDVLHFFLGIEAAVFGTFAVDAFRTDFGQFRVFLDFNAPALVFGEVPVQTVMFSTGMK